MTWDEEKWAKRSDRLAIQINVDQERVEIQVNNIHQPKPGRLAAKEAKHEAAGQVGHTNTDCHNDTVFEVFEEQKQKEQAGQLVVEALQFEQNLIPNSEQARTKNKILSPSASKRDETTGLSVQLLTGPQPNSTGIKAHPSRLSMAVAAAAQRRSHTALKESLARPNTPTSATR